MLKDDKKAAEQVKKENQDILEEIDIDSLKTVRKIDKSDHYLGNINAQVELIVYSDFDCEFCANYNDTLKKAKDNFGDDLVIAFRHYPMITHSYSYKAAQAAECASEQGKYWEMHDLLFENKKEDIMNEEQIKANAVDLGLDNVKFSKCYDQEKYKEDIQIAFAEAKKFDVTGAPTTFINNIPYTGDVPFEDYINSEKRDMKGLQSIIEEELARKE